MSICYKCDACGRVVPDTRRELMKEFHFKDVIDDNGHKKTINLSRKIKIDLCEQCYLGLYKIAKEKSN